MRIPFDKYERVLLIDTYMKIKARPKSEWQAEIRKLSELYRKYAVLRGCAILWNFMIQIKKPFS